MFCSECGKSASGKFCSNCGSPLESALPVVAWDEQAPSRTAAEVDSEVRYEAILRFPGVREKIAKHARQAPKQMTGEQFLALADKLIPVGVPLEKLAAVVQPLYARLGIKTGKEQSQTIAAPVGQVIVRALCSLARNGQPLQGVTQAADGCSLEAKLPSNVFSFEGKLTVRVRREGSQTAVSGATSIGGQIFDWGKSSRCLEQLFRDLQLDAA